MPLSTTELKQSLTTLAQAAVKGISTATGGAPPPGGPQGVFDVSNNGLEWKPTVRVIAGSGTLFSVVDGEATITAANLGTVEYATQAIFRASPVPADGAVFRIVSPPGEYRYSTSSGAGWADDGDTILKPDSIPLGSNGRAFSTRASEHAATFTAARAMKGLYGRAKHVHIESHTTFGDGGGGVFDVKAIGAYVDDDGTTLVAASSALIRRDITGAVDPRWFGADGRYVSGATPDSTAAFIAALAYCAADPNNRPLRIRRGTYLITDELDIVSHMTIKGEGYGSRIWFNAPTKTLFTFGRLAACWAVTLRNFVITGPTSCGFAALEVVDSLLDFDIKIKVAGGFSYGFYGQQVGGLGAAVQWGTLHLGTMLNWGGPCPGNYIYLDGYFNACHIISHTSHVPGIAVHLIGGTPGTGHGHYSSITGTAQGCGQGFLLDACDGTRFIDWYDEGNTTNSKIQNSYRVRLTSGAGDIVLQDTDGIRAESWLGVVTSTDGVNKRRENVSSWMGVNPVIRENASEITLGGYWQTTTGATVNPAAFAVDDPPNLLLNGDFSRWRSAADQQIVGFTGNYKATRCGDGQTDTARTLLCANSAIIENPTGDVTYPLGLYGNVTGPLPAHLIGCSATVLFKAKVITGPGFGFALYDTTSSSLGATSYGSMLCEDGWTVHSATCEITSAMITNGIRVAVGAVNGSQIRLSEMHVSISSTAPRYFTRCSERLDKKARLGLNGLLDVLVTEVPAGANDPIWSQPWQVGDFARLVTPTVEVTGVRIGWIRSTASWLPVDMGTV